MSKLFHDHLRQMRAKNANAQEITEQAPPTSALGQLHAIAENIRTKRPLLSQAQAFGAALASRPDLYAKYQEESEQ